MIRGIFCAIILSFISITTVMAQQNAEDLLKDRMRTPLLHTEGSMTGEGVCWHAAYDMGRFMDGYRRTQDTSYLDAAVSYYDALIAKLHTSPDGYQGWVGPFIYDENVICDVHIGDAILINPMLDFSETVLKHPDKTVAAKYQDKANAYLQLAKKHLIEKWDARGTWHEDGLYGAYSSWDQYMTADNLKEWRNVPEEKSNLSLPFNKQNAMAIACLRIFRMTEESQYRERALKIFNFMKSRMNLFEDHYVWNYWEPFGEWDIDPDAPNKLRHWVNVHPYRNYQAGEVHEIAEAYHSGITFSKTDIERIINTNINVMWNGDKENPTWHNSNYAVEVAALGEPSIKEAPGGAFKELAGTLWSGLFDFSEKARELSGRSFDTPASFDRHYPDLPVTELDSLFHSNKVFIMAAVIPSVVESGKTANVLSQSRVDGNVSIELFSSDGENKVLDIRKPEELSKQDNAGIQIVKWDTNGISSGKYRIRWILNGEYREFPVVVK